MVPIKLTKYLFFSFGLGHDDDDDVEGGEEGNWFLVM
jgi:hypothetical protein